MIFHKKFILAFLFINIYCSNIASLDLLPKIKKLKLNKVFLKTAKIAIPILTVVSTVLLCKHLKNKSQNTEIMAWKSAWEYEGSFYDFHDFPICTG